MNLRKATFSDVELLTTLRLEQLVDEKLPTNIDIEQQVKTFFGKQLTGADFAQFLISNDDGIVMATGAIIFYPFPPSQYNPSGIRGYIANMYTRKAYRGHGYAKIIMDHLIEEAKKRQVTKLFLYSSEMGRPVYKKYGFIEVDAYMEYTI